MAGRPRATTESATTPERGESPGPASPTAVLDRDLEASSRRPRDLERAYRELLVRPPTTGSLDPQLARDVILRCVTDPEDHAPGVATSVRIPAAVHGIARSVVEARWASSLTDLVVDGLRVRLTDLASFVLDDEATVDVRAALEAHYAEHPEARPSLTMVTQSAAAMEGHAAQHRPDLIDAAVQDLGDDAFVEDVLAWVSGALATEARLTTTPPTAGGRGR